MNDDEFHDTDLVDVEKPMRHVQCGWCPMFLPDDMFEWTRHHFEVHGANGHSVRFVAGGDWDITELLSTEV
jgi:hypothetical protein